MPNPITQGYKGEAYYDEAAGGIFPGTGLGEGWWKSPGQTIDWKDATGNVLSSDTMDIFMAPPAEGSPVPYGFPGSIYQDPEKGLLVGKGGKDYMSQPGNVTWEGKDPWEAQIYSPNPNAKNWTNYFNKLTGSVPYDQMAGYMDLWKQDKSFPWTEMVQDYLNWSAGEPEPMVRLGENGGVEFSGSVFRPTSKVLGRMTPERAVDFGLGEEQVNQWNQSLTSRLDAAAKPLPMYGEMLVNEAKARGTGQGPSETGRTPIGFGGSLLTGGEGMELDPGALLGIGGGTPKGTEMPLAGSEALLRGGL